MQTHAASMTPRSANSAAAATAGMLAACGAMTRKASTRQSLDEALVSARASSCSRSKERRGSGGGRALKRKYWADTNAPARF